MSSGISRAYRVKLLDHLLKNDALSQPSALWVGLYTAAPSATGGGTETTYTNYARVQCDDWTGATAADPSVCYNASAVTFASAAASATIAAFGVFSASSAGDMIAYGAASGTLSVGTTPQFAASALQVTMNETA
ncbi:MAG: hypothetical protein WC374_13350 [Phycisphaerae bacterium]|jgi:uncharacterized Zn-binding protein involved in type VI secretion